MNHSGSEKYLVRYTHPSRYDFEPYGSIWKAFGDNDEYVLYIQVSDSPEEPKWIRISHFLEIAFHEFISSSDFIDDSLRLFKINEVRYLDEVVKKTN